MTAPSPLQASGALNTFSIKSNGTAIDGTIQVSSVQTWTEINRQPRARLVIFDGSASEQDFPVTASTTFAPGAKIEIAAGYDSTNTTIFTGIVSRQSIEAAAEGSPKLVVDLTDNSLKMSLARANAIFENMTDSQVITKLIQAAGLTAKVTATSVQQPALVQYYCSNWDMMLIRAGVNGMVVMADGGTVTVAPPDTSTSPVLTVTFGESVYDLSLTMDSTTQYAPSAIHSYSWDMATLALTQSGSASVSVSEPGSPSSSDLAKVWGVSAFPQQTAGFDAKDELTQWSSADLLKSVLSKVRGTVSFQGSALAVVGKTIALAGLSTRFNGTAFIGGVHHDITDGRWVSTVSIGMSPDWFSATTPNIAAPGAAGLVAPIPGLQTGIVQKVSGDPDGEFRVFVTLPLLQAQSGLGVWARLGTFYASNAVGAVFFPEVGDEVAVAFMNDDPRYPVIVGSLYSKGRPPPVTPDEKNTQKAIVTQSKLEMTFNDQDKIITIKTPGGHQITMDDKATSVSIKDSNGNSAKFESAGVTIESAANMTLSAKGNISVNAQGNLSLKADANATMEGLKISHTAQTQFSATGNAEASVSGSAMLTLKGGLVKIN